MRCIPYTGCMVRKISVHSENEREGEREGEIMTDYIELKEAIDLFYSIDPESDGSDGGTVALTSDDYTSEEIEEMLSLLPAADVAPVVHGEWMRSSRTLWHYCSVCLEDALMSKSTGTEVLSSFCPHCGAKMD